MEGITPQRLPLAVSQENRDGTVGKDARLVNGFIESVDKEHIEVYKRPGMALFSQATAAAGCGVYSWEGALYTIWGNTLYKDNVAVSGTVNTTGGVYTFSSCLGATPKLFLHNGAAAYTYSVSGGLVHVTDVDFPTSAVKGSAYLDGTVYVMTPKAVIDGSGINDPTSWDPLNSLVAQIEPDGGVFLSKQLVYVIAFKQWSVEVFYDAGNAAGSPLGTVQGAKVSIGCRHQDSVQNLEGTLYWIAQARGGGLSVWAMDSLKAQQVSPPAIDRLLQQADFATVRSWTARIVGHKLYAITLVSSNLTLVYDATSRRWYQWTDANGNYLPIVGSSVTEDQQTLLQHESSGVVYKLEMTNYTDAGSAIVFDLYTPNYDGGTRKLKYLHSIDFVADQTVGSLLSVRNSDDDYQSWTNFRQVDLSRKRPRLTQCGSFRRRAYHLRHVANTPLRIRALELQLDLGEL